MSQSTFQQQTSLHQSGHDMIGWATAEATMGALVIGLIVALVVAMACYTPPTVVAAAQRAVESETQLAEAEQEAEEVHQALQRAQQALALSQQTEKQTRAAAEKSRIDEQVLRQKLLGLQGSMHATMFLIDVSGSVGEKLADGTERPNWGGDGTPWSFIRNQVNTWVQHLPVNQYRIIAFSDHYQEFPRESRWANQSADSVLTVEFLDELTPAGLTKTEKALRRAALWKPTNIVLITDGAPSDDDGSFDAGQVKRILQFVGSNEFNIPINVVAVNNYFDPRFGTFLHRLAAKSGGSFIGL